MYVKLKTFIQLPYVNSFQDKPLPRGLFCSEIVAMTFAHHFREIKNSVFNYPIGVSALALAAAAVRFLFDAFTHLPALIPLVG